ncbi:hypothetical protein RFI_07443 [Reticulomyxa filosa]|uniref:Uncharacterized protein n=1 Tax=Reticulomyxa filosa TaxID=46433 RepID=X6NTQ7_RETFI|nr:hypothetical protein RFI_07443 [Reticulomyxa filosa]|eukprot:ETO29675.1 hypothetical protein RFI_07443 [Reticulomyxa filosa]
MIATIQIWKDKTSQKQGSTSIRGFTENDQAAYAEHIQNVANLRSGNQGLGYSQTGKPQLNINSFRLLCDHILLDMFCTLFELEKKGTLLENGQVIELGNQNDKETIEEQTKSKKR